jgi:hypothetical protein
MQENLTRHLTTLFNKDFLSRGIALHKSLLKHNDNFVLWVLCMDNQTFEILHKLDLPKMKLIQLPDLEDEKLIQAKSNRSIVEYCWTLSSSLPLYVLKNNPEIEHIAYLDADTYFFSSIEPIYEEMGTDSILIIRHNYSQHLKYLEKRSGVYNVSLVIFKNNEEGKKCLNTWKEQCLNWCYSYYEDGKLGDQMYLDNWTNEYKNVRVLKHKGANLAPWNINRYTITEKNDKIFVDEDPLIFYHYHSLKLYSDGTNQLYYSSYNIQRKNENLIYPPYLKVLKWADEKLKESCKEFAPNFPKKPNSWIRTKSFVKKILIRYIVLK